MSGIKEDVLVTGLSEPWTVLEIVLAGKTKPGVKLTTAWVTSQSRLLADCRCTGSLMLAAGTKEKVVKSSSGISF